MRQVTITKQDLDLTYTQVGQRAIITASDADSGELVTFVLDNSDMIYSLIERVTRDGEVKLPLADFQVTHVEPVRGEWDSPGTAPEEAGS